MAKVDPGTSAPRDRGAELAKIAEARRAAEGEKVGTAAGIASALFAIPSGPGGMYAAYNTGKTLGGAGYSLSQGDSQGAMRQASSMPLGKYLPKTWSGWFDDDEEEGKINTDGNRED
jgi:hypothetical protein